MTPREKFRRVRDLLEAAVEQAYQHGGDVASMEGANAGLRVHDEMLDEVAVAVLRALQDTWVKEVLPHCPRCARPGEACDCEERTT